MRDDHGLAAHHRVPVHAEPASSKQAVAPSGTGDWLAVFDARRVAGAFGFGPPHEKPERLADGQVGHRRVRVVCDELGIMLIVDEVMANFGRCGAWFVVDHWASAPT